MEIPLFEQNEPLRFERIVLYPYPDLTRIWVRMWLTAVEDVEPNVELRVLNPDGTENTSVFMMAQAEPRIETTLHMRKPVPGRRYQVEAQLSEGLSDSPKVLDIRSFELLLEFRNPEVGEPGFGVGVDWEEVARKAGRE